MPLHDWTRVDDGTYHDFYLAGCGELRTGLNRGRLPKGYTPWSAHTMDVSEWERGVPDGELPPGRRSTISRAYSTSMRSHHPTSIRDHCGDLAYWRKGHSVTIRKSGNQVAVAMIEIVTPGNKQVPVARPIPRKRPRAVSAGESTSCSLTRLPGKGTASGGLHGATIWAAGRHERQPTRRRPRLLHRRVGTAAYVQTFGGATSWPICHFFSMTKDT